MGKDRHIIDLMIFSMQNQELSYPSSEDQAPIMDLHLDAGEHWAFDSQVFQIPQWS